MKIELNGKKALVTGSSGGIGQAIAQGLAEAGAEVVLHGRDAGKLARAAGDRRARARRAPGHRAGRPGHRRRRRLDLRRASGRGHPGEQRRLLRAQVLHRNHRRRLAIHAGRQRRAACACRATTAAPAGGQLGRIVFLSSESALQIPAEMIHYGVSKTALLGVSRGLAELTAGTGVTVNAVLPGPTRSEGVASFFAELAQAQGAAGADGARLHRPEPPQLACAGWPRWRKWPTWWCTPARPRPRPPTARRCVDGGVVRSIA